jgi:hypothetical protein
VVRGVGKESFDVTALSNYTREFVRYVPEAVFFNGARISQDRFEIPEGKRQLGGQETRGGLIFQFFVDSDSTIAAELLGAVVDGRSVECRGYVRLIHGAVEVFKRGFRICSVNIPSRIGVSGWVENDQIRPTAGRDTLDGSSTTLLTSMFRRSSAAKTTSLRSGLAAHIRLVPDFMRQGLVERLGLLSVDLVGGGGASLSLSEIRQQRTTERRVFYTTSGMQTPASEVLSARGHFVVRVSGNHQRRGAEVGECGRGVAGPYRQLIDTHLQAAKEE